MPKANVRTINNDDFVFVLVNIIKCKIVFYGFILLSRSHVSNNVRTNGVNKKLVLA